MTVRFDERGLIVACPGCGRSNRLAFGHLGRAVRCAVCKQELRSPDEPIDVPTTADFDRLVAAAPIPIAVDFWAPWCGPCRMVAPELTKVAARQTGRILVAKVNTDQLDELGERFRIRSIPTLAVWVGGREVARMAGARPAAEIEAFVVDAAANAAR